MLEKFYFYYTNDLHSNFDGWPRVAGYLKKKREKRRLENSSCWLVDLGDHVDRVHPIAEAFRGKANVQLLNDIGYDIATIGNNEGITLSHNDLYHLYDEAQFQVVCANLQNLREGKPPWLQSAVIVQSVGGIKIGIIGLTAPFNAYYELLDWHVADPYKTLENHVKQMKQTADVVILLSHLGISEDQEIARRFSDIDVIIGGHTHHLLRTGETVNNTILTAAGKHCAFVGEVILTWDTEQKKLVRKEAYATDITQVAKDLSTEQTIHELTEKANWLLSQTVVHLNQTINVNWFQDSEMMLQLTDTLKHWTNADIAMLNAGVLLDDLQAGVVTLKDIHRICPHPINPCVVEIDGGELIEVVRASFTKEFMGLKLKGFGFRGEVIGRMMFSGIEINTKVHPDGHESVMEVTCNGKPLDPDRTYSVATADTFTFGRLLPEIAKSETKRYYLPEFLRDLLAYTLKKNFPN